MRALLKDFVRKHLSWLGRLFAYLPSSHYLLLSTLFFVGLELVVILHRWVWVITAAMLLLMVYGIILVRYEERRQFRPSQAVLPIMAAIGLTGFTFFLPPTPLLHLYFTLAGVLLYTILRHGAKRAYPNWNWTASFVVYFLNVAMILGLRWHLSLPLMATIVLVLLVSVLLSGQALRRVAPSKVHVALLALALSLALAELVWVIQFLPLHFLVQAGILVISYYVLFHMLVLSLEHRLHRREALEYLIFGLFSLVLLLTTAEWI